MSETKHQLKVIMFTDIVGYTAMMGEDEEKALSILTHNKNFHKKWIKTYHGTWLKEMGDGILISFESIIDAVYCAGAILSECKKVDGLNLRIGIHPGDVVLDGKEIYGDGVNIASRIQGEALENQIVVSEVVYSNIKNKQEINCTFLEERTLKNVEGLVRIYSIDFDHEVLFTKHITPERKRLNNPVLLIILILVAFGAYFAIDYFFSESSSPPKLTDNPTQIRSLAVLPFANLTGDSTQENLIFGMQDNLITVLSKIKSVDVISRTSTLPYKTREDITLPQIADELNVDAFVEASVLRSDDNIRINVQLVQARPIEKHLWANIFDRPFENLLYMYDEVTQMVADSIGIAIVYYDTSNTTQGKKINPEAYKAYQNGKFYSEIIPSVENQHIAIKHFERSLELDSTFAPAFGGLCWAWISLWQLGGSSPIEAIPKIYSYNQKALELDPNYPEAYYHKAVISLQSEWDWEKSEAAFRKGIELDPNIAMMHSHFGHLFMFQQKWEEAVEQVELGIKLDPLNPHVLGLAAVVYAHHGDYEKALKITSKSDGIFVGIDENIAFMKGNYELSKTLLQDQWQQILDSALLNQIQEVFIHEDYQTSMKILAESLEKQFAGQSNVILAVYYNRAGMTDEVIRILEYGYKNHDANMPYMFAPVGMKNLESDPRYQELAWKMNLPY